MSSTLTCPWCANEGINLAPNTPAYLPEETP
jgi:hypothetical protein